MERKIKFVQFQAVHEENTGFQYYYGLDDYGRVWENYGSGWKLGEMPTEEIQEERR